MSEAEKKWKEWAGKRATETGWNWKIVMGIAMESREAFKAALRREIDKRIKDLPKGFTYPMSAQELIELLDTVEP